MGQVVSVAHVITDLDVGGAERTLAHVAAGLRERGLRQLVVSLKPPGVMADELRAGGVPVHSPGLRPDAPARSATAGLVSLVDLLARARPDVVQTWMYHADVIGGLAARAAGHRNVVWNVRHADLPLEGYGALTAAVGWASVPASRLVPRRIVTNAAASLEAHVARGYPPSRLRLVPNGTRVPDAAALDRRQLRTRLGLPEDALVIGRVARAHPQKDTPTLLRAVGEVHRRLPATRLVLVGAGMSETDHELTRWLREEGLEEAVYRLGPRTDAAHLPAAFDVAVSSSAYGETCPHAVLEAMAAGVPMVVTDVGDAARMVGATGEVVPPRDPAALARALCRLGSAPPAERELRGAAARERVREHYSMAAMVSGYEDLYRELATSRAPRQATGATTTGGADHGGG